jgi:two-component system NarL family response regulator
MNELENWDRSAMRVLLVDDHPLFLEGMHNLLFSHGVEVVGMARDGDEALDKVRELAPDIILMDIRMPRCDGLVATRLIMAEHPDSRIVMLTTSDDEQDLFEAIRSGARGYLLKTLEASSFIEYLEGVMQGEAAISRVHAAILLKEFAHQTNKLKPRDEPASAAHSASPLTPRQREILEHVAQGLSYKEVAHRLNVTEPTIKYHMGEIVRILHLKNRHEVIAYALRTGLVKSNMGH